MTWNDKSYDSTFLPGFESIGEKKYKLQVFFGFLYTGQNEGML